MGYRVQKGKTDADRTRAELIVELNAMPGLNSRLKDVVKRHERVPGYHTKGAMFVVMPPCDGK